MIRDLYWFAFLQSKCIFCSSQMGQRACKGSGNDNERPGRLDSTHRERPNGLLEENHWKHDRVTQDTVRQRQLGSGSQRRDKVRTWKETTFQLSTIVSVAFSSVCGPTYHWGGLLASLASEAKRRYNAIRSNIGPSLEDSAKIPTGQLDLQFLQFWIKRNAWDVTKRSVWQKKPMYV